MNMVQRAEGWICVQRKILRAPCIACLDCGKTIRYSGRRGVYMDIHNRYPLQPEVRSAVPMQLRHSHIQQEWTSGPYSTEIINRVNLRRKRHRADNWTGSTSNALSALF